MLKNKFYFLALLAIVFSSCNGQRSNPNVTDSLPSSPAENTQDPNFNYSLEIPTDWSTHDTIMQGGLRVRFLLPPQSLKSDNPAGNVLITFMEQHEISEFTTNNMNYLKKNMPGISLGERGNIDFSIFNGQWYRYSKEQNGVVRDMINYIIPLKGYAYMITFGTKQGTMIKYRELFDRIVKSFRG